MQPHMQLKALDGLRGVCVIIVVVTHALGMIGENITTFGIVALASFFFTSGFIITSLLLQEIQQSGQLNVPLFYWRRLFRLVPTLCVYVVVSILVMAALGLALRTSDIWAALLFYGNYQAIYNGFRVIGDSSIWSPLGITWSLGPEAHFYLLFPLLVWGLRKRLELLLACLCAFVIGVFAWRCYLVFVVGLEKVSHYRLYCASDTRLDAIAWGCILGVLFHLGRAYKKDYATRIVELLQSRVVLALSAAILVLAMIGSSRSRVFDYTLRYTVESVALAPLYCALFWRGTAPAWVSGFLESRVLVSLGVMSYSLYLYHFGCISVVQRLLPTAPPEIQLSAIALLSLTTGLLSYRLVEAPARRLGTMLQRRFRPPLVSTGAQLATLKEGQ